MILLILFGAIQVLQNFFLGNLTPTLLCWVYYSASLPQMYCSTAEKGNKKFKKNFPKKSVSNYR